MLDHSDKNMEQTAPMEIDENHDENSPASLALIEDVLTKVFEYLPSHDKKNAKLVCKLWFQVLSRKYFVHQEAFFFPHFYSYQTIMKIVDDCLKDRLATVKFELYQFHKNSQIFWRKCGSKIESLYLKKCSFYSDMLLHVFTYCVNLKHLHVEECGTSSHPQCALIKDLIFPAQNENLIRENLSFLDMCVGIPLRVDDLLFVASAFPKLKTLKVVLACTESAETNTTTFSTLVKILQTRFNQLDVLHVKFTFDCKCFYFPRNFSSLNPSNFSRLKKISFSLHAPSMYPLESVAQCIEPMLCYKYWTAVRINTHPAKETALNSDVLICLLREMVFLEELEVNFLYTNVVEFCAVFVALVKSSLKHLRLSLNVDNSTPIRERWCCDHVCQEADSNFGSLSKNYSLRTLNFNSPMEPLGNLFFKYFPNIRDVDSVSWKNIVTISEYQKNLRSLVMYSNRFDQKWNIVWPKVSMKSVEFLEIKNLAVPVEELLNFQFPNLLYLTFEDDPKFRLESENVNIQNIFEEMPKWFPQKFPLLRGLEIQWQNPPKLEDLVVFFQTFGNLRQLRYISLYIHSANLELEAHWKHLLSTYLIRYPSLKALWITNGKYKHNHFYDITLNEFRPFSQCNIFYSTEYDDSIDFKSYWLNER